MQVETDTFGILDKCRECGAFAGFRKGWTGNWSAECTECPNCTNTFRERFQAMVAWNLEQRGIRELGEEGKSAPSPSCPGQAKS